MTLEVNQRGRAGRNIPPPLRARLDSIISRICGDAPSGDDETQDGLLTRLINRALGTVREDRIDVLLGLKSISVPPQAKSGQTILFRDAFTVGADIDIASYPSGSQITLIVLVQVGILLYRQRMTGLRQLWRQITQSGVPMPRCQLAIRKSYSEQEWKAAIIIMHGPVCVWQPPAISRITIFLSLTTRRPMRLYCIEWTTGYSLYLHGR